MVAQLVKTYQCWKHVELTKAIELAYMCLPFTLTTLCSIQRVPSLFPLKYSINHSDYHTSKVAKQIIHSLD